MLSMDKEMQGQKERNNFLVLKDFKHKMALYCMFVYTLLCRYVASVLMAFTLCALGQCSVPRATVLYHHYEQVPLIAPSVLYCTFQQS